MSGEPELVPEIGFTFIDGSTAIYDQKLDIWTVTIREGHNATADDSAAYALVAQLRTWQVRLLNDLLDSIPGRYTETGDEIRLFAKVKGLDLDG